MSDAVLGCVVPADLSDSENRLNEILQFFSKNHEIQIIEDLIYFSEMEIVKLIDSVPEDDFIKCLITMPDVIVEHINLPLIRMMKAKVSNKIQLNEIYSLAEIQVSQEKILKIMKEIRS